jgi:hypothetical protein
MIVCIQVDDAAWLDMHELKSSNEHPMLSRILDCLFNNDTEIIGFGEDVLPSVVPGRKPYAFYSPKT